MLSKLIIALDFNDQKTAFALIDAIDPSSCALKVGLEMFSLFGAPFVRQLVAKGFRVFLDLKFHDIPNTVANACKACADLGVWMLNVHASGGLKMMQAAKNALEAYQQDAPLLIAVTILTSLSEEDLSTIGIQLSLEEEVKTLAQLTLAAGLDGVVCSAHEVKSIKKHCGQAFITVTPGIRTIQSLQHDQQRIMTPEQALRQGSDFLVIGRLVTQSLDPALAIAAILNACKT